MLRGVTFWLRRMTGVIIILLDSAELKLLLLLVFERSKKGEMDTPAGQKLLEVMTASTSRGTHILKETKVGGSSSERD